MARKRQSKPDDGRDLPVTVLKTFAAELASFNGMGRQNTKIFFK